MANSSANLFSVSALIDKGCQVKFSSKGGTIIMPWGQAHQLEKRGALWIWPLAISRSTTQSVLQGQPGIGMALPQSHVLAALVEEEERDTSPFQPALPTTAPLDIREIHEKLGHCDTAVVLKWAERNGISITDHSKIFCNACASKGTRRKNKLLPTQEKLFYVQWSADKRLHVLFNPLTHRFTESDQVETGDKMYFKVPQVPREIWPVIDLGCKDATALVSVEIEQILKLPKPKGADPNTHAPSNVAPGSFKDIEFFRDKERWYAAYATEIDNLMQAMKPVPRSSARSPILKTKTVFKYVWNTDGTLKKRKVRITARGDLAKPGIHYSENNVSSPTLSYKSFRLILAEIAQCGFTAYTMDAIAAYLQARSKKPVWIEAPDNSLESFEGCNQATHCMEVFNSLYGLCQAGYEWYSTLKRELTVNNWEQCPSDPCIWRWIQHGEVIATMGVYVDDLIIGCRPHTLTRITDPIRKVLNFGEVSMATSWTGLRIKHIRNGFEVDMDAYIRNVLHRFNMTECKIAHEPLPSSFEYTVPTEEQIQEARDYPFMQALGSIMFAQLCLFPELSFTVSTLATFGGGWSVAHWKAVTHCLRYMKTLIGKTRKFTSDGKGDMSVDTQVDAAHGSQFSHHTRSRTGWLLYTNGNLTNWCSKLQDTKTATSSTEAEVLAMHDAVAEATWTSEILTFLRNKQGPMVNVYSDSRSAEKGVNNNLLTKRNRSYKARLHDLADKVRSGSMKIHHAPTESLPADSMTKATGKTKHAEHFDATQKLREWKETVQRHQCKSMRGVTGEPEEKGPQESSGKRARYL